MIEARYDILTVDCADPALGLTSTQKRTLRRLAFLHPSVMQWVRWGLVPLASFAGVFVLAAIVLEPILASVGISGSIAGQLAFLALLPIAVTVYRRVARFMRRPYLDAALPLLRMESCMVCGYSLVAQLDKRRPCPECGIVPASVICPECGYWLRGLRDDVKQCPECLATRISSGAA